MLRTVCLAAAFVVAWIGPAAAQTASVAERLAAEIRSALPGAMVTIPDPDGLDLTYAGKTQSVGIGSVRAACAQGSASCDAAIKDYAQRAASYMLDAAPVTRDQLRAVVRTRAYLERMKTQLGPIDSLISEPLSTELAVACYRVLPQGRRPVVTADLAPLQLDAPGAMALCKAKLHEGLAPIATQWKDLPSQGIGVIHFDGEAASYLLSPEEWRPLAERLGGLIVAAPSADTVFYARGTGPIEVDALVTLAKQTQAQASIPLSARALRWTPAGWSEVQN